MTQPVSHNRLKEFRNKVGLTREELADKANTTGTHIYRLETGRHELTAKWRQVFAKILNVSPSDLVSDKTAARLKRIPVYGVTPGGELTETIDHNDEEIIYFDTEKETVCALKMQGDSMDRAGLPEGSYALVDYSQHDPAKLNGKIVILVKEGKSTCKRFKNNPNRFCPESSNPAHEIYFPQDGERWHIWGEVIGSYAKFK